MFLWVSGPGHEGSSCESRLGFRFHDCRFYISNERNTLEELIILVLNVLTSSDLEFVKIAHIPGILTTKHIA